MNNETQNLRFPQSQTFNKDALKLRIQRIRDAIDAEYLLRHLGFKISSVSRKEIRAACKIHGGDNKTAFRMNKENKTWVCFTRSCQDTIGYDLISLVRHVLNLTFIQTLTYLENLAGIDVKDLNSYNQYKCQKDRKDFINQYGNDNNIAPSQLTSEEYLKSFRKFRSDYFKRPKNGAFTDEVLDYFEVGGGYIDKFGFQRDVIPIRDRSGKLVAYSFRDITDKADYSYKYILTKNFNKDSVLYNLHRAVNYMGPQRKLIVVEGFKSVWRLYMAGYRNVVACMGKSITSGQQRLLYSEAFSVIILFDADESGISGTKAAMRDMKDDIDVRPVFLPHTGKDPADYTEQEIHEILGGFNE